jgi:heme-degrading monooxygenase HmoA
MIRVLIERRIDGNAEDVYHKLMREMRGAALHMPGFISGETLRDVADPHHYFLLSMWRTRGDWDRWAVTTERLALREKIAPMLTEPETLTILEHL